jgi:hypothetical protein
MRISAIPEAIPQHPRGLQLGLHFIHPRQLLLLPDPNIKHQYCYNSWTVSAIGSARGVGSSGRGQRCAVGQGSL